MAKEVKKEQEEKQEQEKKFLERLEKRWERWKLDHWLFCWVCRTGFYFYLLGLFFDALDGIFGRAGEALRGENKSSRKSQDGLTAARKVELYNQFKADKYRQIQR